MEEGFLLVSCIMRSLVSLANLSPRPKEFVKVDPYADSDEEESTVGKMPPSDSEDEE